MSVATPKANPWPKLLKRLRGATGLTHQQLADSIGISRRTWRAWLYGERKPSRVAGKFIRTLYAKELGG